MTNQNNVGLSDRFPRIVGRVNELNKFDRYLKDWGKSHVLFYWADGGYGKTRLLEELQEMVKEAGSGYFSGGIIDLYHTASHGSSDVERLIIDNLMRNGKLSGDKYFTNYRRERELYETIRDRGADPVELEKRRASLSQVFIDDFRALALDARKIILCFDTLELIQYESTEIEKIIGVDQVDPRIRGWLLDKLPKLANVLIVFAGRPKSGDFHLRLVGDMQKAFTTTLEVIQLPPFSQEETLDFFGKLPNGQEVLTGEGVFQENEPHSSDYLPLIYLLTGGRPILLHLIYDLLRILSDQPRTIYSMFDHYQPLLLKYQNVPVEQISGNEDLQKARQEVEDQIIRDVVNATVMGGELEMIAFLPKGIDSEIIQCVLGMEEKETEKLIEGMKKLSFVKQHISEQGRATSVQTQGERLFFHDEMYRLMTNPKIIPHVLRNERLMAVSVIERFYNRHIAELEQEVRGVDGIEEKSSRIRRRETLYKLLSERLYYMLVQDPMHGYEEYKRLTAIANAERSTGFAMRVRDEFLRYYNQDLRRKQFEEKGITHGRIVRESAQLWMERFHWGGFYDKAIILGWKVLSDPASFFIRPEDIDVLANICALWARARAMKYGFEQDVLARTQEVLERLPALDDCTPNELLGRGRLYTSIGYLARWGGFFDLACEANIGALASFRKLNAYLEEQAIVLNNLAYVYAKRGQVHLARIYGQEAVKLNKRVGSRYSLGLSYTNLAAVERIARTNYTKAIDYAMQAQTLFSEIEDFHGLVRSYLNLGGARRELAQEQILEMDPDLALKNLESAEGYLNEGLTAATNGELASEIPGLNAEMGKVYRAMGRAYCSLGDVERSEEYSKKAIEQFNKALKWSGWSKVGRADVEEDIAEAFFDMGDQNSARAQLEKVRNSLLAEINQAKELGTEAPNWYYLTFGKVERLSSQISMVEGRLDEGLYGFATAYACFHLFSPSTIDKTQMLDNVFRQYLSDTSFGKLEELVGNLEKRISKQDCKINNVDVIPFIKDLKELIGIR